MQKSQFVGREKEMARLKGLQSKSSASFIVVRGRRRIGKSRLLSEFAKGTNSFFFSGLAPTFYTSASSQRKEFARQLERFGLPGIQSDDWGNLFWHLSKITDKGPILIILDEISWMGDKDPDFLGKLKNVWDLYFSKNPSLILVVCGSVASWIDKNILSSTGFLGRIALDLILEELPLNACSHFWKPKDKKISAHEKFKLLSITGGIPLYLEQIRPELSAEQNIRDLCFARGGLLVREFDEIFSDLFSRKNESYRQLILALTDKPKEFTRLCKDLGKHYGGTYLSHLDDLIKAGFIKRDFTWDLKNGKEAKLSKYRLSDNYLRFYLKYIAPNKSKIERDTFSDGLGPKLVHSDSVMGLQFENLVVHNRKTLWQLLNISCDEIKMDGPFFQTTTARQKGCQIDYLIQTHFNTLYLCEIKFSKHPINIEVIKECEEKIRRLKVPKHCSIRPVLVHVNGVSESVLDAYYFDAIIDLGAFLNSEKPQLPKSSSTMFFASTP